MLDTNIVAVSLPSIARDLHGELTDVEWVVSAYVLPFAALLIPAGSLADWLGRKRTLLLGVVVFTLASMMCGLAPTLATLDCARSLQAIGAALQLSGSLGVIAHGFKPHERTRVFAIWGTVMGLAPSIGPILGGLVTSYLGWRWAFFINLPLGVALIAIAISSVDESRDSKSEGLDYLGIILFGNGLLGIVWALIAANKVGWSTPSTFVKFVIGTMLLLGFVLAERRHPRPMIDLALFRDRTFVGTTIAMLSYGATAQVMMTILPLYLQDAFGQSPVHAGVAMIPFALPLLMGPSVGGRLATQMSSRAILVFGLGLVAFGDATTATTVLADFGYWPVAFGMLMLGAGAGILNSETAKAQISSVPLERAGTASGLSGATRFVGIICGLAGLGAVLAGVSEANLRRIAEKRITDQTVDWHGLSLRIVGGDAVGALATLPGPIRVAISDAMPHAVATGFGITFATAGIVAVLSCVLCWKLIRAKSPAPETSRYAE
jgi:EmrB/QacA subfamily drug resistance transporter